MPLYLLLLAATIAARTPNSQVVIIGDSTASNSKDRGWGNHLAPFFDSSRLTVDRPQSHWCRTQ